MNFVTTTELQKSASAITSKKTPSFIMRRGKPEGIILPFFEGYDVFLDDYMEAYEMYANQTNIVKKLQASEASGISSLAI
ncbi:MAG: hypothetical protein PHH70_03320 [Candidatus Gracilibacteria bacterium]|nr:hypothetical protein [Candidatus Gracilibacteria bacterium]